MRRLMPAVLALAYALLPLFPALIAITGIAFPGVALISEPAALALLGVAALLGLYLTATVLLHPRAGSQPMLRPLFAWLGAAVLAALLGFDPARGLPIAGVFALGIAWHAALLRFYADRGVAAAVCWAYLASGTAAAVAAIVMVATREPAALYAIGHGRAIGTFVLPGELAAYYVVFLPVAYVLARVGAQRWMRVLAWSGLGVGAVALALSYSRAGWMGCAAAFGFLVAAQSRRRPHGAAAALGALCAGALAVVLLFNAHHDPSEDYTRISIWRAAAGVIDRFPLTGVGPFDFARLYAIVRAPDGDATAFHAHSLYLTFFAELGILGLAAFAWTVWAFVSELRARLSRAAPADAFLALALAAGLVGVAVQGLIDTMSIVIFGLWLPTLGFALAAARGRE